MPASCRFFVTQHRATRTQHRRAEGRAPISASPDAVPLADLMHILTPKVSLLTLVHTKGGSMRSHPVRPPSFRRRLVVALIALGCLPLAASAIGRDKVLYVGGTVEGFPLNAPPVVSFGAPKFEGRLDAGTESAFTFEGGRWGRLSIPYQAISSLEYGWRLPSRPGLMVIFGLEQLEELPPELPTGTSYLKVPWDPFEQFTDKMHYVLTLGYQDQAGRQQTVVFELGNDLVRPTLQVLEQRTGKAITFTDVDACILYKTADECGYGTPVELKGLTKAFLDPDIASDHRTRILAELEQASLGLEMVSAPENADMVLTFVAAHSLSPDCPCEGGRGEVSIGQGASRRVVFLFTGSKRGIWGKNPATGFGKALADAFRSANRGTR
jgi:hypothetical protein